MGEVNSGDMCFLGAIDGPPIDLRNRTKTRKHRLWCALNTARCGRRRGRGAPQACNTTGCGFGAYAPPQQPGFARFAARENVSCKQRRIAQQLHTPTRRAQNQKGGNYPIYTECICIKLLRFLWKCAECFLLRASPRGLQVRRGNNGRRL